MGPLKTPPPLPDLEANVVEGASAYAIQHDHNWLQVLEGTIDTVHAVFLHAGSIRAEDQPPGTFAEWELRQRSTAFEGIDTPIGACYAARRDAMPGYNYYRIAQFMMPFYGMSPASGGLLGGGPSALTACVPMDDEHTLYVKFAAVSASPNRPARGDRTQTGGWRLLPNSTDWHGRFLSEANTENDYLLDREAQRSRRFFGVSGISAQDAAVQESMGRIADRSKEHLGTSDSAVIRVRRIWLNAIDDLARNLAPLGMDAPSSYRVRAGNFVIANEADWTLAANDWITAQPGSAAPTVA